MKQHEQKVDTPATAGSSTTAEVVRNVRNTSPAVRPSTEIGTAATAETLSHSRDSWDVNSSKNNAASNSRD